jgi:hypothetical protein
MIPARWLPPGKRAAAATARLDAIDALTARAAADARQLFLFETDACPTRWFVQNGDRM